LIEAACSSAENHVAVTSNLASYQQYSSKTW